MTKRYLALLAGVALVVIGMNEPVVATENVVGAAVTELSVLGTVSGAIGSSVSGLLASPTLARRDWRIGRGSRFLLDRRQVRLEGRSRA